MIYFIAGILFWALIMPIFDKMLEVFVARISLTISEINVKINRCQVEINEMMGEETNTKVIGFDYNSNDFDDEFEVEDE
jgi:hypothetical protein